jgi:hypothetical protein
MGLARWFPALAGLFASAACAASLVGVYPASPVAGEPFLFVVAGNTGSSPAAVTSQSLSIEGTNLVVSLSVTEAGFSVPGFWEAPVGVNGLPAGTYQIVVKVGEASQVALPVNLGSLTVQPSAGSASPAYTALSSNWFNGNESGWGVNVIQGSSGGLFAVWLDYAPSCVFRSPLWLVMPTGMWISPTEFHGLLYQTSGSGMDAAWDPSKMTAVPVGVLSMKFNSATQMEFKGQLFGACGSVEKTRTLSKLQF